MLISENFLDAFDPIDPIPGGGTVTIYHHPVLPGPWGIFSFGPYHTTPDFSSSSHAVSGVVVDIYRANDTVPEVGGGTFTTITDNSGIAIVLFNQGTSLSPWKYRVTYPMGVFDAGRPKFLYEYSSQFPER